MYDKSIFILLGVALSFFGSAKSESLNVCPDEHLARVIIGRTWVGIDPIKHTSLVRRLRFPQEGLYDAPISCLLVTDSAADDSGGKVTITDGGIYHRFVELRLNSQIGKGLTYTILVYSEGKTESVFIDS